MIIGGGDIFNFSSTEHLWVVEINHDEFFIVSTKVL